MVVCLCQGVSEKRVRASVAAGAQTRQQVTEACGAGDGCGSCHRTIKGLIAECRRQQLAARTTISAYPEQQASSAVA